MPPIVFTKENFFSPELSANLSVFDVPSLPATDENLEGFGKVVRNPNDFLAENKTFEIVPWPVKGFRKLDPDTGDEAGTTEGDFEVEWKGDFFYGKNLAVATASNHYLDGLGTVPENAVEDGHGSGKSDPHIYLWMTDYHPDGGQMFWCDEGLPFTVCLGPCNKGDNIRPEDMRAFQVEAGEGVYIHPGTWHNGVYISKDIDKAKFMTRQGRVHARVSASWAHEFSTLLRVPLSDCIVPPA